MGGISCRCGAVPADPEEDEDVDDVMVEMAVPPAAAFLAAN